MTSERRGHDEVFGEWQEFVSMPAPFGQEHPPGVHVARARTVSVPSTPDPRDIVDQLDGLLGMNLPGHEILQAAKDEILALRREVASFVTVAIEEDIWEDDYDGWYIMVKPWQGVGRSVTIYRKQEQS